MSDYFQELNATSIAVRRVITILAPIYICLLLASWIHWIIGSIASIVLYTLLGQLIENPSEYPNGSYKFSNFPVYSLVLGILAFFISVISFFDIEWAANLSFLALVPGLIAYVNIYKTCSSHS